MEKGASGPGLINAGLYALEPSVLSDLPVGAPCSMERELLPRLAAEGRLYGYRLRAAHLDIGTPESLARAGRVIGRLSSLSEAKDPSQPGTDSSAAASE